MNKNLRLVFFGTASFAVASLKKLIENNKNVVAVVTAPDKPGGRGLKVRASPVKTYAAATNIPILQPTNLKSSDFISELKALQPGLHVIVAFRMLPQLIWELPPFGSINLHASLLPQYRGAAPINHAIINGETLTGVTTFFLKHKIDTGDIIFQKKEPIHPEDDAESLYQRLMNKGADTLLKTVHAIENNNYPRIEQKIDETKMMIAPKLFTKDCEIKWTNTAKEIINFIRGLSPAPSAWTIYNKKKVKIFKAKFSKLISQKEIGKFDSDNKNYLIMQVRDATLEILELQLEGKKRMSSQDFLKGNKIS